MRRPEPARAVSWNVMRCHVLHAQCLYPAAVAGMRSALPRLNLLRPPLPPGRKQEGSLCGGRSAPGEAAFFSILHVVPSSRFVLLPSVPPAAAPNAGEHYRWRRRPRLPGAAGTLIRAYPARAPAPVGARRRGAVCAPDCPGAPPRASRTQGALRPLAESGAFFAPARTAKRSGPADAASFSLPNLATVWRISISI